MFLDYTAEPTTKQAKKCVWCNQSLDRDIFHFRENAHEKDGFSYICYECEKIAKATTTKRCADCHKSYSLSGSFWYKSDKNKTGWDARCILCTNQHTKKRAKENPEKHRDESNKWRYENLQKANSTVRNGRAKRIGIIGFHTPEELETLYAQQNGKCFYCSVPIVIHNEEISKTKKRGHVDHYIAITNGGSNDISNLVWSCSTCNIRKSVRSPEDFKIHMKLFHNTEINLRPTSENLNGYTQK